MDASEATRDGAPVILLSLPSGGPPVTLDPTGWASLEAAGVTSVCIKNGGHVVARIGKRQTPAARIVWGDEPPARIGFANGDRRDLRRANLVAAKRPKPRRVPKAPHGAPEATARAAPSEAERKAAIRSLVRAGYRCAWHAERDYLLRHGRYPLAHLLFPRSRP